MTAEEALIQRYFDAFNRHDIDAVMACFDEHAVIVDLEGRRFKGAKTAVWPSHSFTAPAPAAE